MAFSDAIYGKGERYVSKPRLHNMLDYEFKLLIERLGEKRGAQTSFFVFSDTVSARNYLGTNECHGWMGVKFQLQPQAEPSEIVIHVNMLDKENLQQQEALGTVGVNLVYGAFYLHSEPEKLIASLLDGLSTQPHRGRHDQVPRALLQQRRQPPHGACSSSRRASPTPPSSAPTATSSSPPKSSTRKPILIERGSFRPVTFVNLDMVDGARQQFLRDAAEAKQEDIVELMEITMSNLLTTGMPSITATSSPAPTPSTPSARWCSSPTTRNTTSSPPTSSATPRAASASSSASRT